MEWNNNNAKEKYRKKKQCNTVSRHKIIFLVNSILSSVISVAFTYALADIISVNTKIFFIEPGGPVSIGSPDWGMPWGAASQGQ